MSLLERIATRLGYMKAGQPVPGWLLATAGSEQFRIPDGSLWESQARLYQQLSWVQIAVSIVAQSCATTAFGVKRLVDEEEEEIINHPFELLLNKPNPLMSRFEFLEATIGYRSITGNAYWWLNRTSEDGEPLELWIIPPHKIKPVPDERLYLKGYLYDPGVGTEVALETWEVVHFKKYHPLSPFVGLSPIESIAVVALGDLKMQSWNTKLFGENNARLPGILAFADSIPDPEWEKIKQDTRDKAAKRELMMLRNAGKGGVEWMQAAMSQKDMEFMAGRKFNKEEIFGLFAPGLASMLDANATEANAIAGKATFSEYALWPLLVAVAEKISNDILPCYGDDLIGEFDNIRVVDRELALKEQQEYSKTHSVDEIRAKYYSDEDLGDERGIMLPAQVQPIPTMMMKSVPIPAPDLFMPKTDTSTIDIELDKWQRKAERIIRQGNNRVCDFESDVIPAELKAVILSMLAEAKSVGDVGVIFKSAKSERMEEYGNFAPLIAALTEATRAMREAA